MKKIMLLSLLGFIMVSCKNDKSAGENPFLCEYTTSDSVPPFEKIKPEHFIPALKKGIEIQNAEIDSIIRNNEKPDFENTVEALEYSGELFNRVNTTFQNIFSANGTDSIVAIAKDMTKLATQHKNNILLNEKLFNRIKSVYEKKESLNLNGEQKMLLEKTYNNFVRGGANLNNEQKKRLREINERLSLLGIDFENKVRNETNSFELVVDKIEDCSGVPQSVIDIAAETAKERGKNGNYVFTLDKSSIMPFLQTADNRNLREKIFKGYISRCDQNNNNDTKKNISEQVLLNTEKAQLFGYKNFAQYALHEKMAKTPENAINLLMQIWNPAINLAKKEAAEIQDIIFKSGENFEVKPWDWFYYAEKIRAEKYNVNEETILPYFSLDNVLQGVFDIAFKLYNLTFIRKNNLHGYHPDVVAYEVMDREKYLGVLFFDFYPRPTKGVGAWMTEYRTQHKLKKDGKWIDVRPVISVVCNFSKPTANKPALLNLDEVTTLFHEFGHALHGLLSQCTYPSLAGTNTPTDFVELPSQIMENWALLPETLKMYARHYKTGNQIPAELTEKIIKSKKFNRGFNNVEYISAALLDMAYQTQDTLIEIKDIDKFEKDEMNKIGLIPQIVPRYRSTYFKHPFAWGYTAGYYSYRWSAVLDADAFEAFAENGYFDKKTANSFRKNILERGGTDDPMKLYIAFRGHQPEVDALLKREGLK